MEEYIYIYIYRQLLSQNALASDHKVNLQIFCWFRDQTASSGLDGQLFHFASIPSPQNSILVCQIINHKMWNSSGSHEILKW